MCECQNWCRTLAPYKIKARTGIPFVTNHHENCPHYNDSLMDVWKVTHDGASFYVDNEQDANDTAGTEAGGDTVSIVKIKIHREVFENLSEFDGL